MRTNAAMAIEKVAFTYDRKVVVTFCLTNAEGNVSHDVFPRLFGETRELFGLECIPNFAADAGKKYLLKTRKASYEYLRDFYFGDPIIIKMWIGEVRGASFVVKAQFVNEATGKVHATGEQLIAYADMTGMPTRLPAEFRELLLAVSGG